LRSGNVEKEATVELTKKKNAQGQQLIELSTSIVTDENFVEDLQVYTNYYGTEHKANLIFEKIEPRLKVNGFEFAPTDRTQSTRKMKRVGASTSHRMEISNSPGRKN
jgi:hypothetical protein